MFEDLKKQAFGYVSKQDKINPVIKYLNKPEEETKEEIEPPVEEPKGFIGLEEQKIDKNVWKVFAKSGEERPDIALMTLETSKKTLKKDNPIGEESLANQLVLSAEVSKGKRKWKKV